MPFNVGPLELVIVLVIALIVLGPKRLPEVGPLDRQRHARVQGRASAATTRTTTTTTSHAPLDRSTASDRAAPSANVGADADRSLAARRDRRPRARRGAERVLRHDRRRATATRGRGVTARATPPRSPLRYEIDARGAVPHPDGDRRRRATTSARSTTRTRARTPLPSQTDINLALLSRRAVRDRRRSNDRATTTSAPGASSTARSPRRRWRSGRLTGPLVCPSCATGGTTLAERFCPRVRHRRSCTARA